MAVLDGHDGTVRDVVFLEDSTRAASAATDGTIKIWDLATHRVLRTTGGGTDQFTALACSPDGKQLAWNGTDFSLNIGILDFDSPLSNLTNHRVVAACERDHWIYHADWSPDSNYVAFSYGKDGDDGVGNPAPGCNICICDLRTGKWTLVTIDGKHNKQPDWVPAQVR